MLRNRMLYLLAGCQGVYFTADTGGGSGGAAGSGAGQGGSGGDSAAGAGGGGGEDVSGLKSALVKERENNKELARQLNEAKSAVAKIQTDAGSVEDFKKQLGEMTAKLKSYEARDARNAALDLAITAAEKEGVVVDVAKAKKYAEKVGGEDFTALAKEAVELFGVKKAPAADGNPGAGASRAFNGQPTGDNPGDRPPATGPLPKDLGRLYKENRAQYDAIMAERRKGNPFLEAMNG